MLTSKSRRRMPSVMMAGESCASTARRFNWGMRMGDRVDWTVESVDVAVWRYGDRVV
jgi:hypothetical protein